jgi:hypothetical protein
MGAFMGGRFDAEASRRYVLVCVGSEGMALKENRWRVLQAYIFDAASTLL